MRPCIRPVCGLSSDSGIASESARPVRMQSRAARVTSGVTRFSVPISSSEPQRPQLLTRSASARNARDGGISPPCLTRRSVLSDHPVMSPQKSTDVTPIRDWNRLLEGKVALVTGGGDGIGGAISWLFAQHGAQVEIAEIDPARAER